MIILMTCKLYKYRWQKIKDNWLDACGIPYVFVVGDETLPRGGFKHDDTDSSILYVGCKDDYDELVHKVCYAIRAVKQLYDPAFVLKIDDDVVIVPERLAAYKPNNDYEGNSLHTGTFSAWGIEKYSKPVNKQPVFFGESINYCGGPLYCLRRRAIDIVCAEMNPDNLKFEDVNVCLTLKRHGITPTHADLFSEQPNTSAIGWHDQYHMSEQNCK